MTAYSKKSKTQRESKRKRQAQTRPIKQDESGAREFDDQLLIRCPCCLYPELARCTICLSRNAAFLTRTPKQRSKEQSDEPEQVWQEEQVLEYIEPLRRSPEGIPAFMDPNVVPPGVMPERSTMSHGTTERISQIAFKF
jgi:hypothetical protein